MPPSASSKASPDPAWGIYGQKLFGSPEKIKTFQKAGYKAISYYEAFGTTTAFVAELDQKKEGQDYTPMKTLHWGWDKYSGGPIRWVGIQNYYDCDDFAGVYTRKHPRYGGPALTYPDGTVAAGYKNNDPSDPRNSRVLDACIAKNIYGVPMPEAEYPSKCNEIDPKTGKPKGPIAGLVRIYSNENNKWGYASHMGFQKDSACPFWADLQRVSVLYAVDNGLDGMWTDNFGPWDSLGYWTLTKAFGDWSVARFRDHLKKNFSPDALKAMGVADVDKFDIRAALRAKCKALGGDDANIDSPVWLSERWLGDPLWSAFLIYKRQTITEALHNYYVATKEAAAKAGKPDFFVAGNDAPMYSLGTPRGDLDMESVEINAGWHMGTSARGAMMPPIGRYAPMYKLAREHAKSRMVNVWFYLNNGNEQFQGKSGAGKVMEYEMLANNTLPMLHPEVSTHVGNKECNAALFKFVADATPTFGKRVTAEDIGIYYSSSSILAFLTPGGFKDMERQPHSFGVYGWGTALGELHYQYRPIPEWKLSPEILQGLRVFIIPNAEVMDPSQVAIVEPWVKAGGLLIVTGNSGYRKGESGNFAPNDGGLSLASLTGISNMSGLKEQVSTRVQKLSQVGQGKVLFMSENIGMDFYCADNSRKFLLAAFKAAMDQILEGQPAMLLAPEGDIPATVGMNVFQDPRAKRLFVDVNNMDLDLFADKITPAPNTTFNVNLPAWLKDVKKSRIKVSVLSPESAPAVKWKRVGADRIRIKLAPVSTYASVVIEATDKK